MHTEDYIVTHIPMTSLWNGTAFLHASRISELGTEQIKSLLRTKQLPFVIANVGDRLQWLMGQDRYDAWQRKLKGKILDPNDTIIDISDQDAHTMYRASLWQATDNKEYILFEVYH